jgi:hypothetical protein
MAKAIVEYDAEVGAYNIQWVTESRYDWNDKIAGLIVLLKAFPASDRNYNPNTKIWTILEKHWPAFEIVIRGCNIKIEMQEKINAKDWHYEHVTTSNVVSKDTLGKQLIALLGTTADMLQDTIQLKKLYRKKALELHPDRNQGDGSKMSELNSIWSAYNA